MALERGYQIAGGTFAIGSVDGCQEWRFVALALSKHSGASLSSMAQELSVFEGVDSYQLSHARN
jgi:putative Mg2+ transporter-C (MgtC) family protein